jgi:hypothetical protein
MLLPWFATAQQAQVAATFANAARQAQSWEIVAHASVLGSAAQEMLGTYCQQTARYNDDGFLRPVGAYYEVTPKLAYVISAALADAGVHVSWASVPDASIHVHSQQQPPVGSTLKDGDMWFGPNDAARIYANGAWRAFTPKLQAPTVVDSGDGLQAAINAAGYGDAIVLDAGMTYAGTTDSLSASATPSSDGDWSTDSLSVSPSWDGEDEAAGETDGTYSVSSVTFTHNVIAHNVPPPWNPNRALWCVACGHEAERHMGGLQRDECAHVTQSTHDGPATTCGCRYRTFSFDKPEAKPESASPFVRAMDV